MSKLSKKFSGEEKTVAKNYGALVILQGLNYLLPLLIIPFLERQLGLEKFGLVMLAQYLMVFCVVSTDFGFNLTATREIALIKEQKGDYSIIYFKVFWARMILLVLVFLILMAVVFSFERFSQNWAVYLLSYGVVIGQAIFPVWFFQGIEKMRLITIINVIAKVIFTVLLFLFITKPGDFLNVPIFNSIGFITAGVISFIMSLKHVSWRWPDFDGTKNFYKESFLVFSSNIASQVSVAANGLILGFFAGDAVVGVYSAFEKLILAAKNMYVPIYQAIYPYMSRKELKEKRTMMSKLIPIIAGIGILGYAIIYFLGDWVIELLYKDQRIIDNISLFKVLGLIAVFSGLSMLFNVLYAPARKLFKYRMQIMIMAAIFNLVFSFIFVPIYGLKATVLVATITELFLLFLAVLYYKKDLKTYA
ncbi:oligosaccharide flippase family protein [Nonlabens ulvanivorans]|uniref:oligosaccharide flippase family protein n=1 Tax=Nonlabens ulvanivorans TaxID=906888 RepID=UPI0029428944|nr:oligosaccharide flippase family protein [Nonlabens ulvanivorans]WOI22392.1 oligosaccharide flippase family protein [Nonlabens ulvanivorans]